MKPASTFADRALVCGFERSHHVAARSSAGFEPNDTSFWRGLDAEPATERPGDAQP
jgi:hypothetical protein